MNSNSWHDFRQKAARAPKRIVLADGEDPRVIKAAAIVQAEHIALPTLVGSTAKIQPLWRQFAGSLPLPCLDPSTLSASQLETFVNHFLALPKNKSLTKKDALARLQDSLTLGCLALKSGQADGFIGGAVRTTGDTLRAIFSIIGLAPRVSTLFGFFLLERRGISPDSDSLILLADCAVIPEPSPKQLSNIAIGGAAAFEFLTGEKARVAFLSFSTKGSAEHPFVEKVREALQMARAKAPDIAMEGEWQADAALDAFSAQIKDVGDSPLAGKANVLVVPDLNCGNIAYKLVQRIGSCRAVGPVLWGTAQPANDLSRGCSTEDVVDMIALTTLQAQEAPSLVGTAKSRK